VVLRSHNNQTPVVATTFRLNDGTTAPVGTVIRAFAPGGTTIIGCATVDVPGQVCINVNGKDATGTTDAYPTAGQAFCLKYTVASSPLTVPSVITYADVLSTATGTSTNGCRTFLGSSGFFSVLINPPLQYCPLSAPARLLDTRPGTTGCHTPGTALVTNTTRNEIAIGTCTGIPSSALSVVGNVTSVNPVGGGYITLFPSGVARPTVANLNYGTGQVINNAFTVGLRASDGAFTIFTSTTTDLVIDVSGYYSTLASDANGTGLQYAALASPVRFLDTRSGQTACDAPNAVLTATTTRTELVRTSCTGIPSAALAIVGNVTPVAPLTGGHETLYPAGVSQPTVSNVNYAAGDIINAAFIVGLRASDGAFSIYTSATTNLVIDVSGYFAP